MRWSLDSPQHIFVGGEMGDRTGHPGEQIEIVCCELRDAREPIGQFGKCEASLHWNAHSNQS
jgi:hypothetical protein